MVIKKFTVVQQCKLSNRGFHNTLVFITSSRRPSFLDNITFPVEVSLPRIMETSFLGICAQEEQGTSYAFIHLGGVGVGGFGWSLELDGNWKWVFVL